MSKPITQIRFITGGAGVGKTHKLKQMLKEDPSSLRLAATTGIAAINLAEKDSDNITTINSLLKFFNVESLERSYVEGWLQRRLLKLASRFRWLAIDEVSMFTAKALNILVKAMDRVNRVKQVQDRGGLGLLLTGDFCQLPPVPNKLVDADNPENQYAFEWVDWKERVEVEKLTKVYRQSNPDFIEALNAARRGDGAMCGELLDKLGCLVEEYEVDFKGTTIMSTNAEVDRHNEMCLEDLLGQGKQRYIETSFRWGKQRSEWKQIPDKLILAEDAYVMILVNDTMDFQYANGSCGWIKDDHSGQVYVELRQKDVQRGQGLVVAIPDLERFNYEDELDDEPKPIYMSKTEYLKKWGGGTHLKPRDTNKKKLTTRDLEFQYAYRQYCHSLTLENQRQRGGIMKPYFDFNEGKWVVGAIRYKPIRLAYATTVHKSQGLTLDAVQIDPYNGFYGMPAMLYVALSRCKGPEGLRVVGNRELIERRCNVAEEVLEWI